MFFNFKQDRLCAESVFLDDIADKFGTPCFVYSRAAIESQWRALDDAFGEHPHSICYAVKANSNLAVLNVLARLGSGFDIVSAGEFARVLAAGGDADKVVFSGVAKSTEELNYVIDNDIGCINIESTSEIERVQAVAAAQDRIVNVALRVNPDVDARTHPYIATGLLNSKFGVSMDAAFDAYRHINALSHLRVHSMTCHIGSQITELQPFVDSVARVAELINRLKAFGIELEKIDLGGGLGIDYSGEVIPSAADYIGALLSELAKNEIDLPVSIEPGRYIAGNAGVLLTRVEYLKNTVHKNFAIVDAGMNDLLRPSLYSAFHEIVNTNAVDDAETAVFDIVGPVCESADVLGVERELALVEGDLLAIKSAGAYSFTMSSNYNSRPRAAEVMVDGKSIHLARQRETIDQLMQGESILP